MVHIPCVSKDSTYNKLQKLSYITIKVLMDCTYETQNGLHVDEQMFLKVLF